MKVPWRSAPTGRWGEGPTRRGDGRRAPRDCLPTVAANTVDACQAPCDEGGCRVWSARSCVCRYPSGDAAETRLAQSDGRRRAWRVVGCSYLLFNPVLGQCGSTHPLTPVERFAVHGCRGSRGSRPVSVDMHSGEVVAMRFAYWRRPGSHGSRSSRVAGTSRRRAGTAPGPLGAACGRRPPRDHRDPAARLTVVVVVATSSIRERAPAPALP